MEIEIIGIIGLNRGEHSKERKFRRNGYQTKKWATLIGEIELAVPRISKGKYTPFFSQALGELNESFKNFCAFSYICGITTRYTGKLMENIGLKAVDKSAVSRYSKKILKKAEEALDKRNLSTLDCPVIMVDALYEKVRIAFAYCKVAVIVVTGIGLDGSRHLLDIHVCFSESTRTYRKIFKKLLDRGFVRPELVISDANTGIRKAVVQSFPGCVWQSCSVHLMRKTLSKVKKKNKLNFLNSLHQVYQAKDDKDSRQAIRILKKSWEASESKAVNYFLDRVEDTLAYHQFPEVDYHKIYTTNLHERFNRSIRKRTKCSNLFPSIQSYRRLVISFFEYYGSAWEENSSFSQEELSSMRRQGELRRKQVDELLGDQSFNLETGVLETDTIFIGATGIELRDEEINQTALVLIAVSANGNGPCKAIDFTITGGFNDQQKYQTFFSNVQNHLSGNPLVICECGQPVLEQILPGFFDSSQLKYSSKDLLEEFLSFIPIFLRDPVTGFSDVLFYNDSPSKALGVVHSIKNLWNGQLTEAIDILTGYLPATYDNNGRSIQKTYKKCFNQAEKFFKLPGLLTKNKRDLKSLKSDLAHSLNRLNQPKRTRRSSY